MADKCLIIVGAGLAGLATGCYGHMNGYKTKIFEKQAKPPEIVEDPLQFFPSQQIEFASKRTIVDFQPISLFMRGIFFRG